MKYFYHLTQLIAIICVSGLVSGENAKFSKIDVNSGLPYNAVRAIVSDNNGLIWIGTELGLVRFDGRNLKTFQFDPQDVTSLADSYVYDLALDGQGHLWAAGGQNGISRYNYVTDDFTRIAEGEGLSSNSTFSIEYAGGNELWVSTDEGLDLYDIKLNEFRHYSHETNNIHSIPNNIIRSLFTDNDGTVWIGSDSGLAFYDREGNKFIRISLNEEIEPIVRTIEQDTNGTMWVGTKGQGLFAIKPKGWTVRKYDFGENIKSVLSLKTDNHGNVWVGTFNSGVFKISSSQELSSFRPDKSNSKSISGKTITAIHSDQFGNLWFGTYNNGINYFHPTSLTFGASDNSLNSFSCLPSTDIRSVLEVEEGVLLLGTIEGLIELDLRTHKCDFYKHDPENGLSISGNEIYDIIKDSDSTIWVATSFGLNKFQRKRGVFFKHENFLPNQAIHTILDADDSLYLSTIKGLFKLDKDSEELKEIESIKRILKNGLIWSISKGNNNSLFIGHSHGIAYYDADLDEAIRIKFNDSTFNGKEVRNVKFDPAGILWATFEGIGVIQFSYDSSNKLEGKKVKTGQLEGFSSILLDLPSRVWVTSQNYGIYKVDVRSGNVTNYKEKNGLHGNQFNFGSTTKLTDGSIFFGGSKGFDLFHPKDLTFNLTPPEVKLTGINIFGKEMIVNKEYDGLTLDKKNLSIATNIEISHFNSIFTLEFTALHFENIASITYSYLLEGSEYNSWSDFSNNSSVTFNSLAAGKYIFKVKAKSANGVLSNRDLMMSIRIHPPPWKTWWAYTLYIIAFISLMYLWYRIRTKSLRKRALDLEKSVNQRTHELSDEKKKVEALLSQKNEEFATISHEFRTPLTLVLGPLKQLIKEEKSKEKSSKMKTIKRNSLRLLRMVDQLLYMEKFRATKQGIRKVIHLQTIVHHLASSFNDLCDEKSIRFILKENQDVWLKTTPDAIEKILLNLLSNAVKYTPKGGVISFSSILLNDVSCQITVTDTGVGIAEEMQEQVFERYIRVLDSASERITGAGIGLSLVKELIDEHQGSIKLNSKLGQGSDFIVELPVTAERTSQVNIENFNIESIDIELQNLAGINESLQAPEIVEPDLEFINSDNDDFIAAESRPVVLIVEDNADMRAFIAGTVSQKFHCLLAKNGQQGIDKALDKIPDLIISDIMMPEKDGYELTEFLKQDVRTSHIPIILLTARGDRKSRLTGWKYQVDEYLTKPFDEEELLIRTANILSIRALLRKRFGQHLMQGGELGIESIKNELNPVDARFLKSFEEIIENSFGSSEVNGKTLAKDMALSERQLQRKIKALIDTSPAEYLKNYRLRKARQMLRGGDVIKSVAYDCGFSSVSYFSNCFKARFGVTPKHASD